ncbi:hypothetical protein EYZ11_000359 [Aspergillus tanneri]|uniref:DUF7721 domain-containing protein n=1 Tax=Aspergillus tanneri TaxID=1220188 RepID=A0A4S3JXJ0_9EURO|nr:uncharacterized protein ATNIH1004_004333 [Aspergillus tanneri]KAA8648448.1 hypothetical protein ATNIH1004_004333 [Aspergillus tanneri]THD00168.1 hypothetical protein EYZ11_000359 [Aspergillus tanneri]
MSFTGLIQDAINKHTGGSQNPGYNNNNNHDDEFNPAVSHAQAHHSSEDSSLFNSALSFINERKSQYANTNSYDIDESHMVQSHQAMYGGGDQDRRAHDADSLGAGAAMQALKMFTSGSADSSGGGGTDKNKLIGIAMAQAGKLWDEKNSNGGVSGDKQTAINKAAEMALKMYLKGQGSGSTGTGGPSGLMSLASKLMK